MSYNLSTELLQDDQVEPLLCPTCGEETKGAGIYDDYLAYCPSCEVVVENNPQYKETGE